jgi:hypothetical protein
MRVIRRMIPMIKPMTNAVEEINEKMDEIIGK